MVVAASMLLIAAWREAPTAQDAERSFSIRNMRSALVLDSDLTAKARIRDAAMRLFGRSGVAASSVRAIADAADVSPALVVHHFGSKEQLVRAVDEAVLARIEHAVREVPIDGLETDLIARRTEVVAALLHGDAALCDYLARALAERTPASAELFHRLFAFASRDERLVAAGALRSDSDPFWRAMHQVVLIVGPLILRSLIERELGGELLSEENVGRWLKARADLLQHGLYTTTAPG